MPDLTNLLTSIFFAVATGLFFIFIPAVVMVRLSNLKSDDFLVELALGSALMIVILTIASLVFVIFHVPFYLLYVIPVGSLIGIWYQRSEYPLRFNKKRIVSLITLIVFTTLQSLQMITGGMMVGSTYQFPSLTENMWSISIIAEIANHYPFQHPGMAGFPLQNFHYLYHVLLAGLHNTTGISITDLYYRFSTMLAAFIFASGCYCISTLLIKKDIFRILAVFLAIFGGSASYVLPLLYGKSFDWVASSFMADQPFDQIGNPYTVLGFGLFLVSLYVLIRLVESNKYHWRITLIASLIMGTLYGYKSFAGVILVLVIISTSATLLIIRRYSIALTLLLPLIIFTITFFSMTNFHKASLNFAPGWILTRMMVDSNKLKMPDWKIAEDYTWSMHKYSGYIKIRTEEFAIYLLGNLNTRILGLCTMIVLIIQMARKKKLSMALIILGFSIEFSFFIPLLFNLSTRAYDIMQFTPFGMFLLAILSVSALEYLLYAIELSKLRPLITIGSIMVIILLSIPTTLKSFITQITAQKDQLPQSEIQALDYLKKNASVNSVILINPSNIKPMPLYISALSEKRMYMASAIFAEQVGLNPTQRLQTVRDYFESGNWNDQQISFTHIYTIIPKNIDFSGLEKTFDNQQVIIYKKH